MRLEGSKIKQRLKHIHLIAIGGAIMHNLAIALKNKGYKVTGSDDAIYDPARTNLEKNDLLPTIGWDPNSVNESIDIIILGMHARKDNPELLKAQKLGISIMSFPEFVANESKEKKRLVVAGSHGKTTTTAMIMHVLSALNMDFDYLVGSSIAGFELSVKLSDAPLIIIEGDEYLSSPIDRRSKFLWYEPHVSIITGIAYDHINVFPTFTSYIDTFDKFIESHSSTSHCFWFAKDEHLKKLMHSADLNAVSYDTPEYSSSREGSTVKIDDIIYKLTVIGKHNLENLSAAQQACEQLGISAQQFYNAAKNFSGAGRRMELVIDNPSQVVYRDFAHSPSKLKATTEAVKETYSGHLVAVFELHTFSSLNKEFLPLYLDAMKSADKALVYYSNDVFKHKKMDPIKASFVAQCFGQVEVIVDASELKKVVDSAYAAGDNILLMSSGTFNSTEFKFG